MIKLSEYYDEMTNKTATVYKDEGRYFVSIKTDSGTTFGSYHETEDVAEQYAEDWVMKK